MKMAWSDEAVLQLRKRYGADVTGFRLVYDTEGCGCAVNGVPALWAVDAPAPGDEEVASEPFALSIDPRQTVFFEEALRIDFRPDNQSFRLSSDSQIYTSRLVLADRRQQSAANAGYGG